MMSTSPGPLLGRKNCAATRSAAGVSRADVLVAAGRRLFAERGYHEVCSEDIAAEAGVATAELRRYFADPQELFYAVSESVEQQLVAILASQAFPDPWQHLTAGIRAFLDASADPALSRIAHVDGPTVLGTHRWRDLHDRYRLPLLTTILEQAAHDGTLRTIDPYCLACLLRGCLTEAGRTIAAAQDPETSRQAAEQSLLALLHGLRGTPV